MNPKPMLWVLLFVFLAGPACGRWNPATVQEMRNTYEHKKEKAGDRYRFVAPDSKVLQVSGKNLNLEGDDLLLRKEGRQYRVPLDQAQNIEKFKLNPGATIGAVLGGVAGLFAAFLIPALVDLGND